MVTQNFLGFLSLTLFFSAVQMVQGQQASCPPESESDVKYVEALVMRQVYEENRIVAPYSTSTLLNSISIYQRFLSAGQCQFYPSCSRYAYRAIENFGPLGGLPMAAERLTRCHPWAYQSNYERVGFLLYDPPREFLNYNPAERHRTSMTYLSREFISAGAFNQRADPLSATEKANELSADISAYKLPIFGEDIRSELKFGCALYKQGEFFRAVTEFKRYLFLYPTANERAQVLLLIACSFYKSKRYTEIHSYLNEAYVSTNDMNLRHFIRYVDALSYYSEGNYERATTMWKSLLIEKPIYSFARNSFVHLTLAYLESEDEDELRSILSYTETKDSSLTTLIEEIRRIVEHKRDERSPLLATIFSALLPGSGQVYSGNLVDGLLAFAVNGLFAFLVVDSFERDYTAGEVIGGIFGLQFYLGNVIGANRAAHSYNENSIAGIIANVRDGWLSRNQFELALVESTYYLTLD